METAVAEDAYAPDMHHHHHLDARDEHELAEQQQQDEQHEEGAERQFIDLAELQAELDASKASFVAWASDTTKAAEECRRRHLHELKGLKGERGGELTTRARTPTPTPPTRALTTPPPPPPKPNHNTNPQQQRRRPSATSTTGRPSARPRRRASVSFRV